jgi:hypothetical protein
MFGLTKIILPLTNLIVRNKSVYNFNNSMRFYDQDNNLIKYSYNIDHTDFYEVDYINNTLTLKTNNAESNDDINKINSLIDYYKQSNNIIKLNNPNISNILLNDNLYYKSNILYIFDNLSMENYKLLDRLCNKTNKLNNDYLVNSYKINTINDIKDVYSNFDNIVNIFAKKFLMHTKYNNQQLYFNCNDIKHPIIPKHITNNMGIVDYRFMNFKYNNFEVIDTIEEYNKLIEHLDYINDIMRFSYKNHCSLVYATIQHRFNIQLSGSDDLVNKILNKQTEDKLKLFNNSFIDQYYTSCFKFYSN